MEREVPDSVTRSIWLLWAVVAWSGLTALLTFIVGDDLILTWAEGNQAAQEVLDEGGLEALKASSINIPGFTQLAVVLFVVFAAMAFVLVAFLRGGHSWARWAITASVVFVLFATAVSVSREVPGLFVALSIGAFGLSVALLMFLWHKDTTAYLKSF